jgi:hypothetical protein
MADLFVGLVAFLKNLGIDVAGVRPATFRNIAGNVHEFAFLLARGANFRGGQNIYSISTLVAFKNRHFTSSYLFGFPSSACIGRSCFDT